MQRLIVALVLCLSTPAFGQGDGVSLEKFTGTWCGWCPYGAWVLDSIESRLGDSAVVLAWHFNDKFEVEAHDTLSQLISDGGHPALSIARAPVLNNPTTKFSEVHPWYTTAKGVIEQAPIVDVDYSYIAYMPSSRSVDLLVTAMPMVEWSERTVWSVLVITEDDLLATQKLYKEEGGGSLPDLQNYPHKNVVRQLAGSVLGDSMGYAWGAGHYLNHYSFTLEENIDPARARLNVLILVETIEGKISIAAKKSLYLDAYAQQYMNPVEPTGFEIYPNPTTESIWLTRAATEVGIVDAVGRTVLVLEMANGAIDISGLATGVYFLSAIVDGQHFIRRLVVN
jgi:hypothetical protein